jgi:diguanylate cyclase (GGDEF)-like protein
MKVTATAFSHENYTFSLLALDDITAQKKTEEALSKANQLLEQQAMTDPLTGIYNRLKIDEMLMKEISRSRRHKIPLSLVMFDIDHFKTINDTFGHHIGDTVLQQLATHIAKHVRKHDYFARWGGEEFMILLTHNTLDTAVDFAENLRAEIEALRIRGLQRITCSFGVAELMDGDDIFSLTKRTDDALYKAKASGRNRVEKA